MTWYAARLLFESRHDQLRDEDPLLEDRIVLFNAESQEAASGLAKTYGQAAQHEYENEVGETVSWVFVKLVDVKEVIEPINETGWDVISFFVQRSELPESVWAGESTA